MEYSLNYSFGNKSYAITQEVNKKANENQLEAIAEGLALTSAEQNHHKSYGIYTNMVLFENKTPVWHTQKRGIYKEHAVKFTE